MLIAALAVLALLVVGGIWVTNRDEPEQVTTAIPQAVAQPTNVDEPTVTTAPTAVLSPTPEDVATTEPAEEAVLPAPTAVEEATVEPTPTVVPLADPAQFGTLSIIQPDNDSVPRAVLWLRRLPAPDANSSYRLRLTLRDDTVQLFEPIELTHFGTALLEYELDGIALDQLFLVELVSESADQSQRSVQLAGAFDAEQSVVQLMSSAEFRENYPLLTEPDTPARPDGQIGVLRIVSSADVQPFGFQFEAAQLPAPPDGTSYTLWLTDPDFGTELNLGVLDLLGGNLFAAGEQAVNLLDYARVVISAEAIGTSPTQISGEIIYVGDLKQQSDVRALFDTIALPPFTSITFLKEQHAIAKQHYDLALAAQANGELVEIRRHIEHVMNILDGEEGDMFGDVDGDGQVQNPGNGDGVRGYLDFIALQMEEQLDEIETLSPNQRFYAERLNQATQNALATTLAVLDLGARIQVVDSAEEAQPLLEEMLIHTDNIIIGRDLDGNGVIDPLTDEGAVRAILDFALGLIETPLFENSQANLPTIQPRTVVRTIPLNRPQASSFSVSPLFICESP